MKLILGILVGSLESPQPMAESLIDAMQSIQVIQGDGGQPGDYQQGIKLVLRAERSPGASSDYALMTSPLLKPGNRIIVLVTLNATPRVLFDGVIAHRQLSPGGAAEPPGLTLMGKDLSLLMDLEDQDKRFPAQGDDAIAKSILGEYSRYGIQARVSKPETSWTPAEDERVASQSCTDLQYLRQLAARNSFIFQVKAGPKPKQSEAYWGPLKYDDSPQKALTVNMGSATNVERLDFVEDPLGPSKIFGAVYNEQDPESTPISMEESSQSTPLAKNPGLSANASLVHKRRLRYTGATMAEAQALAQAMTNRSTERVLRVTGSLDTLQYGDILVAPGKVNLRGAGMSLNGAYYVRKVIHDISPGQYKQQFELSREGLGSLVNTVSI